LTFPALLALATDPVIATILDFSEPRDIKAWLVADQLHVRKQTVISSLDTLVARGFLTDHGRSLNRVRSFTLAWAQSGIASERTAPSD
jgi:DNA-binding IclR family transcriptional regulator